MVDLRREVLNLGVLKYWRAVSTPHSRSDVSMDESSESRHRSPLFISMKWQ